MDVSTVELVRSVADRFESIEEEVVEASAAAAFALIPALGVDPAIAGEVRASYRANLRRFVFVARHVDAPPPVDVPPEALDIARTLVHRGIEIDALFQGYRRGQEVAWQYWLESASLVVGPGPELLAVLEASLSLLFRYVDDVLAKVIAEAQRERDEILGGAIARRAETARLVLNDAPISAAAASRVLGYELDRSHTAVILWAEAPGVPQGALESAAGSLARTLGTRRPFTMAAGASTLWVWLGSNSVLAPPDLIEALRDISDDIRAAVGPTERGISGFRHSHDSAIAVHRLLAGQLGGTRAATYSELEVTALAAHDELRAAEFVRATLGALAVDEPASEHLRETLRVFLEEADNAPRTAARLHTHRNTILQRVAKATGILGHPVSERRLAVSLALELAHRLGSRVLIPAT